MPINRKSFYLTIVTVSILSHTQAIAAQMVMDVSRIAFGSCNKQDQPQPLWETILVNDPDLFIWTGDSVYNDTEDMGLMEENYRQQKEHPDYIKFREAMPRRRIIGVWDDNDYGADDAGLFYPQRDESQQRFLDFLDEPADSWRRHTAGIYTSKTYSAGSEWITVILLDTRYFREDPGEQADILGEAQWAWLEDVLKRSQSALHIIVTSIQFVSEEHPFESWGKFPAAKARMYQLLRETHVSGVIFISGDRHFGELSVNTDPTEVPYPIYDLTSSGLTHAWEDLTEESNRFRKGEFFNDLNFGYIEINWDAESPTIFLQIRDQKNVPRISQEVKLQELQ